MRGIHKIGIILSTALICGCMHSSELIKLGSINTRSDVFKVISNDGKISQGNAELTLNVTFKKEKEGKGLFGNTPSGASAPTLLVNIDGQAMSTNATIREEKTHNIDFRDPEAGVGIRLIFNSKVEIKAGAHHFIIAIPECNIAIEREITLRESTNNMTLEPVYRGTAIRKRGQGLFGSTSFHEGINSFIVKLNGTAI